MDASVESGALVHGEQSWDVVILPEVDTLPLAAWKQLAAFRESGGTIMALGAKPLNSEEQFPSPQVSRIAKRMLELNETGTGIFLEKWNDLVLVDTLRKHVGDGLGISNDKSPLRYTHRIRDREEIVFVINDSDLSCEEIITLPLTGPVERWDPITGKIEPIGTGKAIHCNFDPYQGILFHSLSER